MSADVLRKAAALMRERAEKAEPGRWKTWGMSVMADPKGTSDVSDAIDVAAADTPSTSTRRLHTGNADHIASWHPAVALAVADWLWVIAAYFEHEEHSEAWEPYEAALTVATAYLGGDA